MIGFSEWLKFKELVKPIRGVIELTHKPLDADGLTYRFIFKLDKTKVFDIKGLESTLINLCERIRPLGGRIETKFDWVVP